MYLIDYCHRFRKFCKSDLEDIMITLKCGSQINDTTTEKALGGVPNFQQTKQIRTTIMKVVKINSTKEEIYKNDW